MTKSRYTEYIKANLPQTLDAYEQGTGEGVWILVTPETKEAHDRDEAGGIYDGILDNDSLYYPGLNHGTRLPVEMRGDLRPVVPFSWLENYRIALQAWEKNEQARGKTPAQYETKEDYITAKMAFYEFLDGSNEPEGKA